MAVAGDLPVWAHMSAPTGRKLLPNPALNPCSSDTLVEGALFCEEGGFHVEKEKAIQWMESLTT